MARFPRPAPWARRAIEAAAVGAFLAIASLVGTGLSGAGEAIALPNGAAGALLLAPAVLSIGVLTTAYPVGLAATRSDALLGATAAFLVAADLTVVLAGGRVALHGLGAVVPAGLLVGVASAVPAIAGIAAGQAASPLGFGRRAGAWTAGIAALGSIGVLVVLATLA